jgi:hypothetical protein
VVDRGGFAAGEGAHGLDVGPAGDRRELGDGVAIPPQGEHRERGLHERFHAHVEVVLFVFVGALARGGAAPDAHVGSHAQTYGNPA